MDTFENENMEQPVQSESVAQPQTEQENPGYYHGAGAGHREIPFAGSPYVTYHYPSQGSYQQPRQTSQPWQQNIYRQPWQQSDQSGQPQPSSPQPKKKKSGWKRIVAAVLVVSLVAVGCGVSVVLTNNYWKNQFALLDQRFDEKLDVLHQQIEDNKAAGAPGGELVTPGENLTASEVFEQNVNSVVAITAISRTNSMGQSYESRSEGTGFIITEDGYVVTNHHVIDGANMINVTMNNGQEYAAEKIGSDATNDIALLKIYGTNFVPVTIGSSGSMRVGDQVVAIGNALGELSSSLTVGYISGIDRDVSTDGSIINMIQTDAAINSGNSGGPLFNARGEVIGINTAKYSGTTNSGASIEGIGFAIPIDDVIGMLDDLKDYGYIRSAYLGVAVREMDPSVAAAYGLPMGVYVQEVTMGYCAEKAGVRAKDIIIGLGGYEIENTNDLSRALRAYEAGETITITVWRSGQEVILEITLDEKPQS